MSDPIDPGEGLPSPASSASDPISAGSAPEDDLYAIPGYYWRPGSSPAPGRSSEPPAGLPGPSSTTSPAARPPRDGDDPSPASDAADDAEEEEEGDDDDDDEYPDSMTSAVQQHVYEGGLRYHAFRHGKYAFPNDEVEQNRDDMKHTMTLMLCHGRHFYAPVEERLREGGKCLDLGTGTGIWAIEVGESYPAATITGIDLSPIQPNYVPENVHFFVDDFEEDWPDPESAFDFIHMRHTTHSARDRAALLARVHAHLKPGGHLEVQELHYRAHCDDGSVTEATPYAFRDFLSFMDEGLRALGGDLNAVVGLPAEMAAAGFEDVRAVVHKCPLGVWPRDGRLRLCGMFLRTAIMDGLRGLSGRPLGMGLGWTPLQIEMFLVEVRKAVMDARYHTYFPLHVVYGRKPL